MSLDSRSPGGQSESLKRYNERWVFAAAAFVGGVLLAATAIGAGVRVGLGGRDLTLVAALLVETGLALSGFLAGRAVEKRSAVERHAVESQRLHDEMTRLQARIAVMQRMAAIGEVGATVAHEIRNPLAIIRTLAQNMGDARGATPQVQQTCAAVLDEIDRVSRVTTTLVGLARPIAPRLEAVAPGLILARAEWLARRLLDGRPVLLTVRHLGPPTPLVGDADLVCQVLLELVANAAAVTPPGGMIALASEVRDQSVILSVCDEGPGIPPEERSRIFDPFVSNRIGGSGIGLAVARQIIVSQRGSLSVHTSETGGARLEIALPLAVPA